MADFHLLLYLYTSDVAGIHIKVFMMSSHKLYSDPLTQGHIPGLCRAIINGDKAGAQAWQRCEAWTNIEQLVLAVATGSPTDITPSSAAVSANISGKDQWACVQCTLLNSADSVVCEACQLPRMVS